MAALAVMTTNPLHALISRNEKLATPRVRTWMAELDNERTWHLVQDSTVTHTSSSVGELIDPSDWIANERHPHPADSASL